jgi:hypothetical protein
MGILNTLIIVKNKIRSYHHYDDITTQAHKCLIHLLHDRNEAKPLIYIGLGVHPNIPKYGTTSHNSPHKLAQYTYIVGLHVPTVDLVYFKSLSALVGWCLIVSS